MEFPVRTIKDFGKVVFSILFLLSFYSCKNSNSRSVPEKDEIVITVKSDGNIKIQETNKFTAKKGDKWEKLRSPAEAKIKVDDGFEIKSWHLGDAAGVALKGSYQFNEDSTVVVTSKRKTLVTASYRIEHWQQNIENDEYNKKEEENKTGEVGKDTEAIAKAYTGFTKKAFNQDKIKADGSTIIKIKYDRNISSIILNLDGGETTTQLEKGEGNRKLLKGKFGAKVEIKKPTKQDFIFVEWLPSLPQNFPAEDDGTVHKAQWESNEAEVYINGDERLDIVNDVKIKVKFTDTNTWKTIKAQVEAQTPLKAEWNNGDYGIYEWRENDENGRLLDDDTPITQGMKLFAITNYIKFNIKETKLVGYNGGEPRGKIIIGKEVKEIGKEAFKDCRLITHVDFSRCENLMIIGERAFMACNSLTELNLSPCERLLRIEIGAFYNCQNLENIDVSNCKRLVIIGMEAFAWCVKASKINLAGCSVLNTVKQQAFYKCEALKHVDLSGCKNLREIDSAVFFSCKSLKEIDLSACKSLIKIGDNVFYDCKALESVNLSNLVLVEEIGKGAFRECPKLKEIDLSHFEKLEKLEQSTFHESREAIVKLHPNIKTIKKFAFGDAVATYCKQVIVPNDEIKQKVIDSKYPENRVKVE